MIRFLFWDGQWSGHQKYVQKFIIGGIQTYNSLKCIKCISSNRRRSNSFAIYDLHSSFSLADCLIHVYSGIDSYYRTWGVQVLRSPNLFKKNCSPQEAENEVISQRNHPVDIHIFYNAHATIAWPQQTLL